MIDCLPTERRKRKRFRLFLPALLAAAISAVAAGGAAAQSTYETFLSLLNQGRYDDARAWAEEVASSEQARRNNLAFLEALIHKRERRLEEAARQLSELLDADPSQGRVRQELAHTLFLMGQDDRARHHFEFLRSMAGNAQLRATYDQFLTAIRGRRPWTLDGFLGFAPSTNINDGTPGETVIIGGVPFTNENAARSGVGLSYGLSGSYRFDLDPRWSLSVSGSLSGASYTESRLDWLILRGYAGVIRESGPWRLGGGLGGLRSFSGWSAYGSGIGPYVSVHRRIGRGALNTRLSWMRRRYDSVPAYDGSEADIAFSYRHIFSARFAASLGAMAIRTRTARDFTSYNGVLPNVSADYLAGPNLILHARVSYQHRAYRGVFPLTAAPRRDHRYMFAVGATLRGLSFRGYVPRINYEYYHARSNVALFQRDRHGVSIVITKRY